jgi:hypothetical protein
MTLPPADQSYSGPFAYVVARASSPSVRLAVGLGALYGLIGGLCGALQVLGAGLAVSLNQEAIARYQAQYATYQDCLGASASPGLCQPPTIGVLAVNSIWGLFLVAGLVAFALAQVAYSRAARAAATRTRSRTTGVMAALIAALIGWLLYLGASVISVLAQASPFTMTAPPLGVEVATLHLGAAIGYAIVDSLALLPTLIVAALVGLVGAVRGKRAAGPDRFLVVSYGPPPTSADEWIDTIPTPQPTASRAWIDRRVGA